MPVGLSHIQMSGPPSDYPAHQGCGTGASTVLPASVGVNGGTIGAAGPSRRWAAGADASETPWCSWLGLVPGARI